MTEMKSYLSLIPISAKVRKRQNRMTLLCIVISVLLVTTIFSMADMAIRMETTRLIEKHGNWHIQLKALDEQQLEQITRQANVAAFSRYDGLNYRLDEDYSINGKPCVIVGGDSALLTDIYDSLSEGRFPVKADEILLSDRTKSMFSLNIGDSVTLHTRPHQIHVLAEYRRFGHAAHPFRSAFLYDLRFRRGRNPLHQRGCCGRFPELGFLCSSRSNRKQCACARLLHPFCQAYAYPKGDCDSARNLWTD